MGGFGFDELVVGEKGGKFGVGVFGEGDVPGIKGSAEGGAGYLFDLLDVVVGVRDCNE